MDMMIMKKRDYETCIYKMRIFACTKRNKIRGQSDLLFSFLFYILHMYGNSRNLKKEHLIIF